MLKAKAGGFKPKARPRPNANASSASTPATSAKPSVERQTETPAPPSEPQALPVNAIESTRIQGLDAAEKVSSATNATIVTASATTAREERQPVIQPIARTTSAQESTSRQISPPITHSRTTSQAPVTAAPVTAAPVTAAPVTSSIAHSHSASTSRTSVAAAASTSSTRHAAPEPAPRARKNPFLRDNDSFQDAGNLGTTSAEPVANRTSSNPFLRNDDNFQDAGSLGTNSTEPPASDETRPLSASGASRPAQSTTANKTRPTTSHPSTARTVATKGNSSAESRKRSRPLPTAPSRSDTGEGTSSLPARQTKRRKVTSASQDDVRPTIEDQDSQDSQDSQESTVTKPRRKSKKSRKPRDPNAPKRTRRGTPSDAEEQVVDTATIKMADLTKDLHIGRRFEKAELIIQRENEAKERRRLERERSRERHERSEASGDEDEDGEDQDNPENGENEPPAARNIATPANAPVAQSGGPRIRIVNGQLVVDDSSLQVDRRALAAEGAEEMEVFQEDDFSRVTTCGSHANREKNDSWGHFDTELFYQGLREFGADFQMISKMFGSRRSRKQVKHKFTKEDKLNPARVTRSLQAALLGKASAVDPSKVKHYSKMEETEDIIAMLEAKDRAFEEGNRKADEALAEEDRQKRAKIVAGGASGGAVGGETQSTKENETNTAQKGNAATRGKKKETKKSKRAMIQHFGGEDAIVVGTIDD